MAETSDVIGGVGTAVQGAADIIQSGLSYDAARKDLDVQNAQLRYSKRLQRQIFQREDTATYRKVQDLRRAGLSPVLAAGQGAGTGAVVPINTPKNPAPEIPNVDAAMAAFKMSEDISRTAAENKYIKQQTEKADAEKTLTNIHAAQAAYDLYVSQKSGIPSNGSPFGKIYKDAVGAALTADQKLQEQLKRMEQRKKAGIIEKLIFGHDPNIKY